MEKRQHYLDKCDKLRYVGGMAVVNLFKISSEWHFEDNEQGVSIARFSYDTTNEQFHRHDFYELVIICDGTGMHVTYDGVFPIARGNFFLVYPDHPHSYRQIQGLKLINVLFRPEILPQAFFDLVRDDGYNLLFKSNNRMASFSKFQTQMRLNETELEAVQGMVCAMETEQKAHRPGWHFALNYSFFQLVLFLSRTTDRILQSNPRIARLGAIMQYVRQNCIQDGMTVSKVAAKFYMTVRTLERLFASTLGKTFQEYLNGCRLAIGAEQLVTSTASITRIAYQSGFQDSNYFCKLFKKYYFLSPRDYRNANVFSTDDAHKKKIVECGREDLPHIQEMARAGLNLTYSNALDKVNARKLLEEDYNLDALKARMDNGTRFSLLVLNRPDRVIGFFGWHVAEEGEPPVRVACIDECFVHPRFRENGFGRMLMDEAQHEATLAGCGVIRIGLIVQNQVALNAFQRFGFSIVRQGRIKLSGNTLPSNVLEKVLKPMPNWT